MDQIKATLSRKVGPFAIGAWLLIIVGGVALGLAIKRSLGGGEDDFTGTSMPSGGQLGTIDNSLPATQGIVTNSQLASDFGTFKTEVRTEQNRMLEELENRLDDLFPSGSEGSDTGVFPDDAPDPDGDGFSGNNRGSDGNAPGQVGGPNPTSRAYTVRNGETWEQLASRIIGDLYRVSGGDSGGAPSIAVAIQLLKGGVPTNAEGGPRAGETIHVQRA